MKSRIKEDDNSVPYFLNDYWYITKYEKNKEYPIYTRKYMDLDAEEEILLDVNVLAKDYDYYQISGISISPDNKKMAFGVDTLSRRIYTIKVKDLSTGEMYPDKIDGVNSYSTWAADSKTMFYTGKDEQTLRSNKIFRHSLGEIKMMMNLSMRKKMKLFQHLYIPQNQENIL